MSYKQNLTPREVEVVEFLPASHGELSDAFGFSQSTSRDHINSMERKGVPIASRRVDNDGSTVKEYYVRERRRQENQNDTREYGSVSKKAAKTKRLNNVAENLSKRLDKALNATTPAVSVEPLSSGGDEDVAIHVTDDHIGDILEDEHGNVVFDTETAVAKIRERVTRTLEIIERQKAAGWNFHTVHYIMGGDIITGSGIYQGQAWEVEKNFNEQIDIATSVHFDQIKRLADEFEAVQVVCQTGNHGEIRISGSSEKANGDDIVYRMLDLAVRASEYDNITFVRNHKSNYTNFRMRCDEEADKERAYELGYDSVDELPESERTGHRALLRHGKDMKAQSETRAASDDLRGWKLMHEFDVMYAGHFHIQSMDRVMEAPLIRSGSIAPTDEFEESISEWSMPMSTVHGVSDDNPKSWSYDVQYDADQTA
jgi:hypothetical protein